MRRQLLLAVTMLLPVCVGCGEDSGSFAAVEQVELLVDPTSVTFTSQGIGQTSQQTITVINQGGAQANLNIKFEEVTKPEDQNREFGWAGDLANLLKDEVLVKGGDSLTLIATYTPADSVSDEGNIVINYNAGQRITIPVSTNEIAPDIDGPSRVIFGRVPAGASAKRTITIQNVGRAPLQLQRMSLSAVTGEFTVCIPFSANSEECLALDTPGAYPETLEYLDTVDVRILYEPVNDGEDSTTLLIESSDPDERPFLIDINANGAEPCITVTDEAGIDFSSAFIGGVSSRTLTINNCSPNKELEIDSITMAEGSDPEYFVEPVPPPLPDQKLIVGVGGTSSFVLNYAPGAETSNTGTIEIISNDEAKSPLLIPVTGRGSTNTCPTPIAKAREVGTANPPARAVETIPLATIEFDATESFDPDGSAGVDGISGFEWSIIERPVDSTARLVPNATEAKPKLFLDLAGTYKIELRVFDSQNAPSCETAQVNILATPDEDIHVQLVWNTPGDPDEDDSGVGRGSDLDLHFLHPLGMWNEAPWDAYWLNPSPNWSTPASSDDPSLDIDDTDGSGPENLNLNNPEAVTYRVGAFYFADHNYGPSYATIRIFLAQVLVFEYRDKYLERTGKFWDIAAVEWGPAPRVNQIDQIYDGIP
jgi:hypothetical protein